jgi:FxsC-like protein
MGVLNLAKWADGRDGYIYREVISRLAARIMEVAQTSLFPVDAAPDWDLTPNAFGEYQAEIGPKQVRIIMAVYPAGTATMTSQCSPARENGHRFYGHTMRAWSPYRDGTDDGTLAARAVGLVEGMGHTAVLDPLDERAPGVDAPAPAPTVLLVDPWALGVPQIAEQLQAIDHEDPVHVVVPWNVNDEETRRLEAPLRANLNRSIPNCMRLQGSQRHVTDLFDFRAKFPKTVGMAIKKFVIRASRGH